MEKKKGTQCHECERFGHIQVACANTIKKKKKAFSVTWNNEDSNIEGGEDEKHVS